MAGKKAGREGFSYFLTVLPGKNIFYKKPIRCSGWVSYMMELAIKQ
jgi:hypothetical protein